MAKEVSSQENEEEVYHVIVKSYKFQGAPGSSNNPLFFFFFFFFIYLFIYFSFVV